MSAGVITAVGIDVSKYKSTVAARRPGGEVVLLPFDVSHDVAGIKKLLENCMASKMKMARFGLLWSIRECIGDPWLWLCNRPDFLSAL